MAESSDLDESATGPASENTSEKLQQFQRMGEMAARDLLSNSALPISRKTVSEAGEQFDGKRMVDEILGYPQNPDVNTFRSYYDDRAIASVIVDRPANDSWRENPIIKDGSDGESDFVNEWEALVKKHKIYNQLERLDRLTGIGRFGALLMGFDDADSDSQDQPLDDPSQLLYIRPYSEENVDIDKIQGEMGEERFGYPLTYDFDLSDNEHDYTFNVELGNKNIHYSRVLHVAEGLLDNEIYGEPRLQKVLNRLCDLDKLIGAAPEAFWQQAAKGYHVKEQEEAELEEQDFEEIAEEFRSYLHGFKRVISSSGADVKELAGATDVDPSNPFDIVISVIAAKTGIPKRVLLGSERGELSSTQDRKNWFDRVHNRRVNYVQPVILEPFIDRILKYDIISPPKNGTYEIEWPNLWQPNRLEQAEIMNKKASALKSASGGMPQSLMDGPKIVEFVFDMDPGEAKEVWKEQENPGAEQEPLDEESEEVQEQSRVGEQIEQVLNQTK